MKRYEIALLGEEEKYISNLQNFLNMNHVLPYPVCGFTSKSKFMDYAEGNPIRLLIADEELLFQKEGKGLEDKLKNIPLLYFSEERNSERIFRYQSAEQIANDIIRLSDLSPHSRGSGTSEKKGELIGIYSPVGRCLKTSFAFTLGQMLSRKHKVLYLNLESFSGLTERLNTSQNIDIADLLYYFKNLKDSFSKRYSEGRCTINGMDYIPPALSYIDLTSITEEEWMNFLDELFIQGEYEYILLDLSDHIQGLLEILRKCSRVYTITKNDGPAFAKMNQYEKLLMELKYEDILDKSCKCSLPVFHNLPINLEELAYSELGDMVRQITRGDFSW